LYRESTETEGCFSGFSVQKALRFCGLSVQTALCFSGFSVQTALSFSGFSVQTALSFPVSSFLQPSLSLGYL
jgi:hypothetical protein